MRGAHLLLSLPLSLSACDDTESRPPKHSGEIYVSDAGGAAATERYAYLAKRSLAVVGLAEARAMSDAASHAAVDHIADALDACVTDMGMRGAVPEGAARLVVQFAADGSVAGAGLSRVEPETGPVVATAKLCLEARVKLMAIAPSGAGPRAMAIEASWGSLLVPKTP